MVIPVCSRVWLGSVFQVFDQLMRKLLLFDNELKYFIFKIRQFFSLLIDGKIKTFYNLWIEIIFHAINEFIQSKY